ASRWRAGQPRTRRVPSRSAPPQSSRARRPRKWRPPRRTCSKRPRSSAGWCRGYGCDLPSLTLTSSLGRLSVSAHPVSLAMFPPPVPLFVVLTPWPPLRSPPPLSPPSYAPPPVPPPSPPAHRHPAHELPHARPVRALCPLVPASTPRRAALQALRDRIGAPSRTGGRSLGAGAAPWLEPRPRGRSAPNRNSVRGIRMLRDGKGRMSFPLSQRERGTGGEDPGTEETGVRTFDGGLGEGTLTEGSKGLRTSRRGGQGVRACEGVRR